MDVILSVGEPVIEMSMLSGLSNMLDSIAYAKNGGTKATSAIANLAVGYLSQGIPTIGGQIARSIDKTRRDTYTGLPSGGFGDTVMRQVKKDLNKIPGLSFLNQPYTNAYGETEENVYKVLDRLSKYTDQTSYNFADMAQNIGKFTSVGIDLVSAEQQMEGIANWAARSGAGINEASRAMYNLSQAMGVGKLTRIDWKSIENAGMATKEFKEQLIQAGVAAGTLV